MIKKILITCMLFNSFVLFAQKNMDLAKTPPMGWNSWNKFGCDVSEKLIREMADAFVSNGLKDAGYEYIVIDDCWQVRRDGNGIIIPDSSRFPSGIKALADYIHAKGLKFGIYSDAGRKTCAGRPGGYMYEEIDAKTYASWGVDYLKYDWCSNEGIDPKAVYPKMSKALATSGRPIVFSMCEWGFNRPWSWAEKVGHLWRTTGDIVDCWDCKKDWGGMGWVTILDAQQGLEKYSGPGHWNDPDMLEVGNGGMKQNEYIAHFSFWCLLDAPLMAGNDLRSMNDETKSILLNKEAIAVNQDPLGIQGSKKNDDGDFEIYSKPLSNGDVAVILFNRNGDPGEFEVNWAKLGITGKYQIRDLWKHENIGAVSQNQKITIGGHSVLFFRIGTHLK